MSFGETTCFRSHYVVFLGQTLYPNATSLKPDQEVMGILLGQTEKEGRDLSAVD